MLRKLKQWYNFKSYNEKKISKFIKDFFRKEKILIHKPNSKGFIKINGVNILKVRLPTNDVLDLFNIQELKEITGWIDNGNTGYEWTTKYYSRYLNRGKMCEDTVPFEINTNIIKNIPDELRFLTEDEYY